MNKFYVGAKHISLAISCNQNDPWTHKTLDKAIEHAKTILEENEHQECAHIVQVIRIVRRKVVKVPIIVEKV